MKVQRVHFPETERDTYLVLDDDYRAIEPILSYLNFLHDLDRSPNTIRACAHHLKLFWEYLRDTRLDWTQVDIAQLAAFISWLRRPQPAVVSLEPQQARRTNATIDQMLGSVHGLYDFHVRIETLPELPLYRFLTLPNRRYKPFLHAIAKSKPMQTRIVSVKREKRHARILTQQEVQALLDACTHIRDRFLLTLMYDTGMRIGQVLGLRHEDINVEDGEIQIVPRDDNANGARAKTRDSFTIPGLLPLMQLYTDYLIEDLGALEVETLPDYVFVNLWEGDIGQPMTYAAVRSLVRRLSRRTGISFTPHMLRHTRATTWIRDDKHSLATVSRLLGHGSVETTDETYVTLTPQDLKRALMEGKESGDER